MKFNKITDKRPEALQDHHMPKSYDISLKAYGGGGTAKSLNPKPKKLKHQSMKGFEDQYKNIIDYIVINVFICLYSFFVTGGRKKSKIRTF